MEEVFRNIDEYQRRHGVEPLSEEDAARLANEELHAGRPATEAAWQQWAKRAVEGASVGLWDAGRLQREARGFVRDVAYDKLDELAEWMRRNCPKEQRTYFAYKLLGDVREEES